MTPIRPRSLVAAATTVLTLAAVPFATATESAVLRLMGSSPVYGTSVDVKKVGGGTLRVRPARYHYRITQGDTVRASSGFCVDTSHYILTGRDYPVTLQTAADAPDMATDRYREAGWLVAQADGWIAAATDPQREAAALQVAVWQLTGQAADVGDPTSDPALNGRVAEMRQTAAGKRLPDALDVEVAGERTCTEEVATVTVTGTPGAVVDLTAQPLSATITPAQVTIGPGGVAGAELRTTAAGDVTVHAETAAPIPVRATKLAGATNPQDQLMVRPRVLEDTDTQPFVICDLYTLRGPGSPLPVPPPLVAPGPTAPPAPAPEAAPDPPPAESPPPEPLGVSFTAPAVATPGGVAVYRIRVRNDGRGTLRAVRVTQALRDGITPLRATGPRGVRTRLGRTAVTWTLPALRRGQSVVVTSTVRVPRSLVGDVGHARVTVRRGGSAIRTQAATAVLRPVGKTEQGF